MTVVSSTVNRRSSIQRWTYAPLVATIAVAAACAGAGTGSAEVDGTSAPGSASTFHWTVHNFTDAELTGGEFSKSESNTSTVRAAGMAAEGGSATSAESLRPPPGSGNKTKASNVCYKHTAWSIDFTTTMGPEWDDVFVYYDVKSHTLFITPQGGHSDRNLSQVGTC